MRFQMPIYNRYDFITTSGGSINCDKVMGNFYLSFSIQSLKMSTIWMLQLLNVAQRLSLNVHAQGGYSHNNHYAMTVTAVLRALRLAVQFWKTYHFSRAGYCPQPVYVSFGITIIWWYLRHEITKTY